MEGQPAKKPTKKGKQAVEPSNEEGKTNYTPRSFVFQSGRVDRIIRELMLDVRAVMLPNTAPNLRRRSENSLQDFIRAGKELGLTELLILTSTEVSSYLRISRLPQGPTLTFKIVSYSTAKDIRRRLPNPSALDAAKMHTNPVVILHGFSKTAPPEVNITQTVLKRLFPAMNINTLELSNVHRVVFFNLVDDHIEFRHYCITTRIADVAVNIHKIAHRKPVDLNQLEDISEFVLNSHRPQSNNVTTGETSERKVIRLKEIGPRMKLQLIKVEDNVCTGAVLYHRFIHKTQAEVEEMKKKRMQIRQRKEAARRKLERRKQAAAGEEGGGEGESSAAAGEGEDNYEEVAEDDVDPDEDIEWYRKEVGAEPTEEMKQSLKRSSSAETKLVRTRKKEKKKETDEEGDTAEDTLNNSNLKKRKRKSLRGAHSPSAAGRKWKKQPIRSTSSSKQNASLKRRKITSNRRKSS